MDYGTDAHLCGSIINHSIVDVSGHMSASSYDLTLYKHMRKKLLNVNVNPMPSHMSIHFPLKTCLGFQGGNLPYSHCYGLTYVQ